jgi:uncharacterized protein (DUF2164 family)
VKLKRDREKTKTDLIEKLGIEETITREDESSCGSKEAKKRCRFIAAEWSHSYYNDVE